MARPVYYSIQEGRSLMDAFVIPDGMVFVKVYYMGVWVMDLKVPLTSFLSYKSDLEILKESG